MNANIIHDPSFPHGTPGGFNLGCHGAHCPALLPCRDVYRRYSGDWSFRKKVDAGLTLAEILADEATQEQVAQEPAPARRRKPRRKTGDGRASANRARAGSTTLIPRRELRTLLDQGLTDRQIADRYGLTRRQVAGARTTAGWERNPDTNRRPVGSKKTNQPPATPGAMSTQETP